jgi:hypothetical protein
MNTRFREVCNKCPVFRRVSEDSTQWIWLPGGVGTAVFDMRGDGATIAVVQAAECEGCCMAVEHAAFSAMNVSEQPGRRG